MAEVNHVIEMLLYILHDYDIASKQSVHRLTLYVQYTQLYCSLN